MAEYHAHKIRPSRIAYRVGIDIALIEALIAGEEEPELFPRLVTFYRRQRYRQRLHDSHSRSGSARYQLEQQIEREFRGETDI